MASESLYTPSCESLVDHDTMKTPFLKLYTAFFIVAVVDVGRNDSHH